MAEFFCHDFDVGFLLLEIHLGVGCIDFVWGGGSGLMALIPFLWSECAKEGLLVFSKFMVSTGCLLAQQEALNCSAMKAFGGSVL